MLCKDGHRNEKKLAKLPIDQGGNGRHKCAGCAYDVGLQDGLQRKERIYIDLDSLPQS